MGHVDSAKRSEGPRLLFFPVQKHVKGASAKAVRGRQLLSRNKDYPLFRQIIWDIVSINSNLEEMRRHWARKFGVSGPQWMILMAINDLDQGEGVPVGEVSAKIHAVSTFVTTQTKLLEQRGLLSRVSSTARRPGRAAVIVGPGLSRDFAVLR